MSRMVGQVLTSTVAAASLDLSSRMMACVVRTHADVLTCRAEGLEARARRGAWEQTARGPTIGAAPRAALPTYLHNHLDGRECGGEVLGVGGPHGDGHAAAVQAAVEGSDELQPWGDGRAEGVRQRPRAPHRVQSPGHKATGPAVPAHVHASWRGAGRGARPPACTCAPVPALLSTTGSGRGHSLFLQLSCMFRSLRDERLGQP